MVINSFERAVSTDINRSQAFRLQDQNELLRYMVNVSALTDDLDAAASDTEFNTQGNPLLGEIMNGLLVQPQGGSLNLLVTPGVAFVIDPDTVPSADDSVYKMVHDAGVTTLGALAMTSNSSGSIRIDVIEVQRQDNTVETDNRDIFNPTTGLFSATTVTKGLQGQFTYRVRAGTPGAGFPGTAQGWLPIAVASVPNGTTVNDTITFWDVRPLLNDRIHAPFNITRSINKILRQQGRFNPSTKQLFGIFEGEVNGRRVGGRIRPGTPQTDTPNYLDLSLAANLDPTSTFTGTKCWFLYYVTPFGLPRWARYTDGPTGRVPRSPRGIPVVSAVGPLQDGTPSGAITLPTVSGLAGSSSTAFCVAAGQILSGTFVAMVFDGKASIGSNGNPQTTQINTSSLGASQAQFTLDGTVYNIYYPAHAKAIWVIFDIVGSLPNTTAVPCLMSYSINDAANDAQVGNGIGIVMQVNSSGGAYSNWEVAVLVRIPIQTDYPTATLATRTLAFNYQGLTFTPTGAHARIDGWEL